MLPGLYRGFPAWLIIRVGLLILRYFSQLRLGKAVLWCYLLWYVVVLFFYFDPAPRIWLNSAGISVVIGIALVLSVTGPGASRPEPWQIARLFLMPFCVSSFSSLIKGQGFVLIFPPRVNELIACVGVCLCFVLVVSLLKVRRAGSL